MNSSTPLIITGMHRSGTSLIARFAHKSGIDLGDRLLEAKKSNIHGHYEDIQILKFHRDILERELGHQMWVDHIPLTTARDRELAMALITARQHKPTWGWKDPRTCLFLDFWGDLLPDAHFLFVVRNPKLVLSSLGRRGGTRFYQVLTHNVFMRAWLMYNEECYRFYMDHPHRCLLLILEHVLEHPTKAVGLLSECLHHRFEPEVFRSSFDASVLTRRPKRSLVVSPFLRTKCISLYSKLCQDADL